MNRIQEIISASITLKQQVLADAELLARVQASTDRCIEAFRQDRKVLFCGNGGSAADAQHLAAEFSGRFYYDRDPLFAEALHVNTSYLTAVGNDYSFAAIYERIVRAKGRAGDILFGISTSGNSENIVRAMRTARELGMITIGMTGASGGQLAGESDILLNVPSSDTPRIQEVHILLGHIICELVEAAIFPR
jgi:D-sedoheptulose 7-phosphate isomerase